ncbi:hypothetical protein ACEPAF_6556 [Sanghuangporus sanghuang]
MHQPPSLVPWIYCAISMTTTGIEIIDLTDSKPQSPTISEISVPVRSIRKEKRSYSSANSPIVISDGDDAPSITVSSDPAKKRRTKRKKRKKVSQAEEEEAIATNHDKENDHGNDGSRRQGTSQSGPVLSMDSDAIRRTSPDTLFYLDDKPDAPPDVNLDLDGTPVTASAPAKDSLLLPDHVVLDTSQAANGTLGTVEASALPESDTEDFIHYADEELNVFTRYYEEPKDESERKAHLVCGQCGAEGDHKQTDCPVVVCLTCGAHNEHSTRQCPIVKTCFACGMKGHIKEDCPNRNAPRRFIDRGYYCARCGSHLHTARECPTLWRLYEYLDDVEREAILKSRREKENLPIGQGGEGYIGEDYWCYNCGGEGHLGDDCRVEPRHSDLKEPSAFGSFNIMSGPFSEQKTALSNGRKLRREWEMDGNFDDGHGFAGPSDVGKRGRDKERERMCRREKEMQKIDNDEDARFGNLQDVGRSSSSATKSKKSKEKMVINLRNGDRSDKDRRPPGVSLMDRISSGNTERGAERRNGIQERERRRSASPTYKRDTDHYRSDNRSRRDRQRGSERDIGRDRRQARNREGDSSYRVSGDDAGRSDRKRDEGRSGRQYYGGYGG